MHAPCGLQHGGRAMERHAGVAPHAASRSVLINASCSADTNLRLFEAILRRFCAAHKHAAAAPVQHRCNLSELAENSGLRNVATFTTAQTIKHPQSKAVNAGGFADDAATAAGSVSISMQGALSGELKSFLFGLFQADKGLPFCATAGGARGGSVADSRGRLRRGVGSTQPVIALRLAGPPVRSLRADCHWSRTVAVAGRSQQLGPAGMEPDDASQHHADSPAGASPRMMDDYPEECVPSQQQTLVAEHPRPRRCMQPACHARTAAHTTPCPF